MSKYSKLKEKIKINHFPSEKEAIAILAFWPFGGNDLRSIPFTRRLQNSKQHKALNIYLFVKLCVFVPWCKFDFPGWTPTWILFPQKKEEIPFCHFVILSFCK